jgi:ADP-ribose pyrophosphatase
MKFETLSSQILFEGRVFEVRRDQVRYPDGRIADFDLVQHGGAVAILPLDSEGRIWFVRQYRHAAGQMLLELPAGTLEDDEAPEACAHREIREEIGMAANKLELLGQFYLAPGYSSEIMYAYLATDLRKDPLEQDADEYLEAEAFLRGEVQEMLRQNQIRDAKTIALLSMARPFLQ